jgi:two-component system sensor histidine kinase KdpD
MTDIRPDPDALLAQVQAEEAKQQRGKLKIFFGAAAGVGKTFTMLSAARDKYAEGMDLVIGYAEPHARPETEVLLLGMDLLPLRIDEYKGTKLKEFDLDAALARHPELVVVDELAHTNAPGLRHAKRWQDIEELLDAGIDVYTTLNVQHIESLNDVVAQITGVIVRETVPDAVFERADEVELVDLPPDELLERLSDGKVYVPDQAAAAVSNFFRKPNLIALRELALRRTADRVNVEVQSARQGALAAQTWPTTELILVCISPSPASSKVIRAAKRLAMSLQAQWIAAWVETPKFQKVSQAERDQLLRNFRLAERLGAETVTLSGLSPCDEIINYARSRNVSKIIAGKSDRPWWRDLLHNSNVDQLLRKSGDIDVYVIHGLAPAGRREADDEPRRPATAATTQAFVPAWPPYAWACVTVLLSTAIAYLMHWLLGLRYGTQFDLTNLAMVYLVGVVLVAARQGRGPSALAAVASVVVFDCVFVPPRWHFSVSDPQYLITFAVMLGVGLLIGTLTVQIREQADDSRQRERRVEALYRITRELADSPTLPELLESARKQLEEVFQGSVLLLLPDDQDKLVPMTMSPGLQPRGHLEQGVAQWVFEHNQPAGRGTDTLPASELLYVPLPAARGVVGVLGLITAQTQELLAPEHRRQLEALCRQVAVAIERHRLAESARQSQVQAETEKLRSSLLSSVSHDLRTPLAVITGASSSLLDGQAKDPATQREMIATIREESERLSRLVSNLLDITRLESGAVTINKQWHPLEEIVGSALNHLDTQLAGHPVKISLPPDLPLVPVDGVLIEQVFINLIENAAKYTLPGTAIEISARVQNNSVIAEVGDYGPGLTPGEEGKAFEKFYRGSLSAGKRGAGLGLPICRAILEVHHGRVWAENRLPAPGAPPTTPAQTGAIFRFTLPLEGQPPRVDTTEQLPAAAAAASPRL